MLLATKYAQFSVEQLAKVREFDTTAVMEHIGGSPAANRRALEVTIAYLKTDPEHGEMITKLIAECPYAPAKLGGPLKGRGGASAAIIAQKNDTIAELEKQLADKEKGSKRPKSKQPATA